MRLKDKSVIVSTLIFTYVVLSVVTFSCKPEGGLKNPANNKLYISVSADQDPAISPFTNLIAYYHKCFEYPESEDHLEDYVL